MVLSYFVSSFTLSRNYSVLAACGGRRRKKDFLGTPQTPARGLRPPAPSAFAACGGRRRKKEGSGDTPDPGKGTASPCTLCFCRLRRQAKKKGRFWGHPRP